MKKILLVPMMALSALFLAACGGEYYSKNDVEKVDVFKEGGVFTTEVHSNNDLGIKGLEEPMEFNFFGNVLRISEDGNKFKAEIINDKSIKKDEGIYFENLGEDNMNVSIDLNN
ncbi:hypothetical protein [Jeotgalibacillus marinus]|uniref:Lipoprotein n=1 Tax=Jeotgalibacillus marinus TaxID=86667 RepID=A0ABV3Q7Q9_9BACL